MQHEKQNRVGRSHPWSHIATKQQKGWRKFGQNKKHPNKGMSSKTIGERKKHTNTSKKGEKTEKQTKGYGKIISKTGI